MSTTKYFYELTVSSSPHCHGPLTTRRIMLDVVIALCLPLAGGIWFFGLRALAMALVSVGACVFFEWGYRRMMKKDPTYTDLSAVVTGLLLALACPPTLPFWALIVGDLFAIVVVKQLYGGIGKNFMNPALAGRAFLMFSWPAAMSTWVVPGRQNFPWISADAVTAATPLSAMHTGALPETGLADLLWGNVGGCMGETSAVLILLGALYLVIRKVISPRIPLCYLGTAAVLAFLFPRGNDRLVWTAYTLLSGGLLLGAFFMATDYVTTPVTKWGQAIFGIGCGVITIVIRYFGAIPEGVSFSILVMNACVVLLDRVGRPRRYGWQKPKKEGKAA